MAYSRKNKKLLFQKKNVVAVIFPFTGPNLIFTLFHSSHSDLIESLCSLHKKRKSGLALVDLGSSGADGKLQQLLHNSSPCEAPGAFPYGCVQEGKAQHNCLWFIRHSRFALFLLLNGREALRSAGHEKSKFTEQPMLNEIEGKC